MMDALRPYGLIREHRRERIDWAITDREREQLKAQWDRAEMRTLMESAPGPETLVGAATDWWGFMLNLDEVAP